MTERLTHLLHAEADGLDIPPPDAASVLRRGRGARRRRQALTAAAALTAAVVVGAGALGLTGATGDGDTAPDPAGSTGTGAAFALGTTVYLEDGAVAAEIDDRAIKSLYYTSAGVLVRHGNNAYSDGGGPQRFSLVRPDGTVERIRVTTEETVPGTDPEQPYLAWAEVTDGDAEVVVRDLRDDTEAARVAIPSADPGGGWAAPPVTLAGDTVYAETGDGLFAVDWRSGEVEDLGDAPAPQGQGRTTTYGEDEISVLDAQGEPLLSVEVSSYAYFMLSPDARYAVAVVEEADLAGEDSFDVYSVDTGEHVSLPGYVYDYGWTAAGDLFRVGEQTVTTCDTGTGECTETPHGITMPPPTPEKEVCETVPQGGGGTTCSIEGGETWESQLKLGGRTYES